MSFKHIRENIRRIELEARVQKVEEKLEDFTEYMAIADYEDAMDRVKWDIERKKTEAMDRCFSWFLGFCVLVFVFCAGGAFEQFLASIR